jgi:phosphoribosyl 1,2-cyclic phosphodiesterase
MFHLNLTQSDVRVHALASGSSGNAYLVQAGSTNLLLDAGLSQRMLASHLARFGVGADGLEAILLTHEHVDHSASAGAMSRRAAAPVVANAATLQAAAQRTDQVFATSELPTGAERGFGCIGIRSFPVPHDAVEPVGYILEVGRKRIVYCTDVGSVTPEVQAALKGASLAIVEANHDLAWLLRGPYTPAMKERVASPTGHLSNAASADLIAHRLVEGGPLTVWLAHLSRVNNSPALARRSVQAQVTTQTSVPFALEIALRDHPSVSWRSGKQAIQPCLTFDDP